MMKTPRTTRSTTARSLRVIGSTLGAILLPASVSAALAVYEPFSTTGTLAGQTGGTGFSGAWSAGTGTSTVSAPGLTYSGLTVVGNRATTPASANTQNRGLSASLGGSTVTTYISFLLRPDNATSAANAEFGLIGSSANVFVGKAASGNTSNYLLDTTTAGGTQNATSTAFANGTAVLMVLRADFVGGASPDSFKLFINPSNAAEPGTADAQASYNVGTISTIQFTGNLGFSFDELKIGSSYADVVPESSTWGSVIAVIGVGCIAWLKHRTVQRAPKATATIPAPVAR